jgi:glycosyltransferase involved in cell wall biosynthesis
MSESQPVDILLSTFNGEAFLPEQLDSLLAQSFSNWRLSIRDDGSTDRTWEILEDYAGRDPRIELLPERAHLGAQGSFSRLLENARPDSVYFLSDQDDVWPEDRLARMLDAFAAAAEAAPSKTPLLLHTDLCAIDAEGRELAPSIHRASVIGHVADDPLGCLIAQNFVTGCSAMFNDALRRAAVPIPATAAGHDWWLALIAAALGSIHYLDRPLIRHRRHPANASRAGRRTRWRDVPFIRQNQSPLRRRLIRRFQQSAALEARLTQMAPDAASTARLKDWNRAWARGGRRAFAAARRLGIRLQGFRRTQFFYWQLLTSGPLDKSPAP